MLKKMIPLFFVLVLTGMPRYSNAQDFETLHEVIRHFKVAFVDKPNMVALLVGGLRGVKRVAPGCQIKVLPHENLFEVSAKKKSLTISKDDLKSFESFEKAMVKVASLVLSAKLTKKKALLEREMIRGIVANCGDRWTVYLDQSIYARILDDGTRKMGSAGILVESRGNGIVVLDVEEGSPAEKAGIRPGMKVNRVAGRPASRLADLEALALMRGEIGKKVEVVIENKKYTFEFVDEPKKNISVEEPKNNIAVVRIHNFRPGTGTRLAGVMRKIMKFTSNKLKGLVLDLRGNPGGLVTEGTEVVGLFINGGDVVSVVSRKHLRTEVENSPRPGPYRNVPLVILADHRSASVSEIVIMALRDYGRAKVIGEKTLGKGTVQVVMELMDGSAVKMSNGRYYSPKGTPIYDGIEPDFEIVWDGKGEDLQLKKAKEML
jgi:carboxyl-terminal processing protease